jgi:hypothetical protein
VASFDHPGREVLRFDDFALSTNVLDRAGAPASPTSTAPTGAFPKARAALHVQVLRPGSDVLDVEDGAWAALRVCDPSQADASPGPRARGPHS